MLCETSSVVFQKLWNHKEVGSLKELLHRKLDYILNHESQHPGRTSGDNI